MTNPTFSSDDLRAIADMIDGFNGIFIKDGEYIVQPNPDYGLDYSGIMISMNGDQIGEAIFEDGWIGFQHD